jgi:hypothetical protein
VVIARTVTHSVECTVDPDVVLELIADPRHTPDWAPAFADTVVEDAQPGIWRLTRKGEQFTLRVAIQPEARTVDYLREVAPGREGGAYLRALPRPDGGSVIVMTMPLPPGGDPASVAATLRNELDTLARLAETRQTTR